jgi:polysaccharide biosynthesis/export protein
VAASLTGCAGSSSDELKASLSAGGSADAKPAVAAVGVPPAGKPAPAAVGAKGATASPIAPVDGAPSEIKAAEAKPGDVKKIEVMTSAVTPGNDAYRVGSQDVLDIVVFKVAELSRTVQVAASGAITYPLLGDVMVAGRTAREIERDLTSRLGSKYLQNPQVTVSIKEFNSQRVLMDGAVTRPGLYPVQGATASLLQLIAVSGGLTPNADSTVVVFRTQGGKKSAAKFDVEEIRTGNLPDPKLEAGDVVVVSNSAWKEGLDKFIRIIPVANVFALL